MTASVEYPKLRLGTAPDSWGVWNPGLDPLQTPWTRYLDEVQAAGYRYSELGPYGYLPTDPGVIRDEYAKRGLTLTGGTVFVALHKGKDALAQAKADCDAEMATIGPARRPPPRDPARGIHGLPGQPHRQPDPDRRRVDRPDGRDVASSAGTSPTRTGPCSCSTPTRTATSAPRRRSSASSTARTPRRSTCASTRGTSRTAAPTTWPSSATTGAGSATSTSSRSTRRSSGASGTSGSGFAPAVRLGVDGRAARRRAGHAGRAGGARGARPGAVLHRRAGPVPVRPGRPPADRDPHPRVLRGTAGSTSGGRPAHAAAGGRP